MADVERAWRNAAYELRVKRSREWKAAKAERRKERKAAAKVAAKVAAARPSAPPPPLPPLGIRRRTGG